MVHKNITVKGIVQGVGFRFSAQRTAKIYGIKGYVKNLPDGHVYIEAEGEADRVKDFIAWCWEGPSHAYVTDVNIENGEIRDYKYFDIKY